jgi:O-antigen/teichoic acid export membrane protein
VTDAARSTSTVPEDEAALRSLTGGAVLSAASRIWVAVAGGATTIVLARILGAHDWGGYSIAVSLLSILGATATLGVDQGIAYFVGGGRWAPRAALSSALKMAGIAGVLGAGAGLAARAMFSSAFAGLPFWLTAVAVAALPFSQALTYVSSVALASDRYEGSTSIPAIQSALVLAISVPAAVLFGRTGAVIALTVAAVVTAIGAVLWAHRELPSPATAENFPLRRAISFGIKGYSANALQLVSFQLDLFILAAVASAAVVGRYALAVRATTLLLLLPEALASVLYPRVARLTAGGDEQARALVETKSLRHVSLIALTGMLAMVAALELLIVPVFGSTYRPAINLALILLPGVAAIGITTVLAATVVGRGRPSYSVYASLITVPITVVMYATMIPAFHATGAALASTLSYIGSLLVYSVFYRRVTGRSVLPLLIPTRDELAELIELPRAAIRWAVSRG